MRRSSCCRAAIISAGRERAVAGALGEHLAQERRRPGRPHGGAVGLLLLDDDELVAVRVQGDERIAELAVERHVGRGVLHGRLVSGDPWRRGERREVGMEVEAGLLVEVADLARGRSSGAAGRRSRRRRSTTGCRRRGPPCRRAAPARTAAASGSAGTGPPPGWRRRPGRDAGLSAPTQPGTSATAAARAMRARPSGVCWAASSAARIVSIAANGSLTCDEVDVRGEERAQHEQPVEVAVPEPDAAGERRRTSTARRRSAAGERSSRAAVTMPPSELAPRDRALRRADRAGGTRRARRAGRAGRPRRRSQSSRTTTRRGRSPPQQGAAATGSGASLAGLSSPGGTRPWLNSSSVPFQFGGTRIVHVAPSAQHAVERFLSGTVWAGGA